MSSAEIDLSSLTDKVSKDLKAFAESYHAGMSADSRDAFMNLHERFNLWANNIGAFHGANDLLSLVHRVRRIPQLKRLFGDILTDMLDDIIEFRQIYDADKHIHDSRSRQASNVQVEGFQEDLTYATFRATRGLSNSIKSLFKASKVVRASTRKDRFLEAQNKNLTQDLGDESDYSGKVVGLFRRLGDPKLEGPRRKLARAGLMRTRYLQYTESHQEKLERGTSNLGNEDDQSVCDDQSAEYPGHPDRESTASTALASEQLGAGDNLLDGGLRDAESVLSYETQTGKESRFQILDLPACDGDGPVICPYCSMVYIIDTSTSEEQRAKTWRMHVFADLRAYVCLHEACALKTFKTSRSWLQHQCAEHLIVWQCLYCDGHKFASRQAFECHMQTAHSVNAQSEAMKQWIEISKVTLQRVKRVECQFCDWTQYQLGHGTRSHASDPETPVPLHRYRRHVAFHLEQTALGMLPERYVKQIDIDLDSDNALATASFRGDEEVVRWLLERGAGTDKFTSALQAAIRAHHEGTIRLLMGWRSEMGAKVDDESTQLAAACGLSGLLLDATRAYTHEDPLDPSLLDHHGVNKSTILDDDDYNEARQATPTQFSIPENVKGGNSPLQCSHPGCTYEVDFFRDWDLQKHISSKHTSEKPFWCPVLGCFKGGSTRAFTRPDTLAQHLRQAHRRENTATCPAGTCEASFSGLRMLGVHIKLRHRNSKEMHMMKTHLRAVMNGVSTNQRFCPVWNCAKQVKLDDFADHLLGHGEAQLVHCKDILAREGYVLSKLGCDHGANDKKPAELCHCQVIGIDLTCPVCACRLTDKEHLKNHIQQSHVQSGEDLSVFREQILELVGMDAALLLGEVWSDVTFTGTQI